MKTAVVVIIFNRPKKTKLLFSSIRKYKPSKLFIISDGPRKNVFDDFEKVKETRKIFEKIPWKCKIFTNYSNKNLGTRKRIVSGIDWVFKNVEEAIFLEDDCIPSNKFFPFMEKMLIRYKSNHKIGSICGSNFLSKWNLNEESYFYSKYFNSWGWATWKNRWQKFDKNLKTLDISKKNKVLKYYLGSFRAYLYWHWILDRVKGYKINSWAYIWIYTGFIKKHLHVIPKINLISNVGIGMDSTHTKSYPVYYIPSNKINNKFNSSLPAPLNVVANHKFDKDVENRIYSKSIQNRIFWILKKIFKH